MNDYQVDVVARERRRPTQGGPPLVLLASISLGLLVGGLIVSFALGGVVPSPFASPELVQAFFAHHGAAVRAAAVFTFGSAIPLSIYAATVSARLRQLGVTAPGATIALAGGVLAAGALGLSGLLLWTLSRSEVSADTSVVGALHTLAFLLGGPAHVVMLGLLVNGVAIPSLIMGFLPKSLAVSGLVIAVIAELTTLVLVWPTLALMLPVVRFPALVWLVAAGVLLPRRRASNRSNPQPHPSAQTEAAGR